MFHKWLSRDQWRERGRDVCVPNSEALDVVNYRSGQSGLYRGAWHVFSEDQTVPLTRQVLEGKVVRHIWEEAERRREMEEERDNRWDAEELEREQ
jgi:hypothetical protein